MPEGRYLAIADADRIHNYVFSASQLKLIRGASAIQFRLNLRVRSAADAARGRPCRASGGTVISLFDSLDDVHEFCRAAHELYREDTRTATVTTAAVPAASGRFSASLQDLFSQLELNKNAKTGVWFIGSTPFWVTCEACGLSPASSWDRSDPQNHQRICSACHLKERRGRPGRELRLLGKFERPSDFERLGELASPENYLAIIYIDLDRLGKYASTNAGDDWRDYRRLSRDIDHAVRHSVRAACDQIRPFQDTRTGQMTDSYEILISGGDDAVVALPAQFAFDFLYDFRSYLNQHHFRAGSRDVPRPTFSAGIVFAHSHFPIAEFVRLAEELLRSAKNIESGDTKRDSVDYAVATRSLTESVERSRVPGRTAKPYSLADFDNLRNAVRELKASAPASKIRTLHQIVHQSAMQAEFEYLNVLWRLDAEPRSILLRQVGHKLWSNGKTRAADLAELWEFVR